MTAYTSVIKAGKYEDDMIPKLAIHAFRHAFEHACASSEVLYVKNQQLMRRMQNGQETAVKDLSQAYVAVSYLPKMLKRKKKLEEIV
ncbi:hypothetical protein BEN74_01740 [Acinetobacter sp. WCHAc010034]|uniref:hypothetical protein n=1 Tax=Acinetobacter sp. WCHAc010034 TaxID=1879049 RepID=UPI00083B013F|nr:hypothetical protein [Acinetobacter sp. WCHAc010034]AYA01728.1 hypothetical protein BEN74_01740 [Acinetobacter sp. WCHAc010034]